MTKVIVVGELRDGELRNVSFEVIQAAKLTGNDSEVVAVILGGNSSHAESMIQAGANRAILLANENFNTPTAEGFTQALLQIINQENPKTIILGHTSLGKDIAPRLAGRLNIAAISDVIEIDGDTFIRPIFSSKAFERITANTETQILTIRPNNIEAPAVDPSRTGEIQTIPVELTDLQTVIQNIVRKVSSGVDLSEAKIIVSGGRGLKSDEGFTILQALADVLGAAIGASRGACDAGYCDYSLQIGQTGKVVTPDLYIACGISGAIQHVAGMSNSKIIVAINKDPEANIFSIADYGIVGDLFEIVPLLTEELKKQLVGV